MLHGHVDVVTPTTYFGTVRSMRSTSILLPPIQAVGSVDPSSCAAGVTPSCLRALYNTASYTPKATDKNSIGVAGYLELYANYADLQVYGPSVFPKFPYNMLVDLLPEVPS